MGEQSALKLHLMDNSWPMTVIGLFPSLPSHCPPPLPLVTSQGALGSPCAEENPMWSGTSDLVR